MTYVVKDMPTQVDARIIGKLAACETATIGHLRQLGFVNRAIQSVIPGKRLAGTAVTLALPGQDSTLMHHALGLLRPGDVLVVDRMGDHKHACFGGGTAAQAKAQGATAVVVDGACADFHEIRMYDVPVWCRGPAPVTTRRYDIGGAMNVPVCCGGVAVLPGYSVLLDDGGVLIMPPEDTEYMADWALDKMATEPAMHRRILEGGEKIGDIGGATKLVQAKLGDNF